MVKHVEMLHHGRQLDREGLRRALMDAPSSRSSLARIARRVGLTSAANVRSSSVRCDRSR
jgi:hypothetical protein